MKKFFEKYLLKYFIIFIIFITLILVFQKNYFRTVDNYFFNTFQKDSEALVIGGIVASKMQIDKQNWNLGFILKNGSLDPGFAYDSYEVFPNVNNYPKSTFFPYKSQIGFQFWYYSIIQKIMNFSDPSRLGYFSCAILSILIIGFFFLYKKIYGTFYSYIFVLTISMSPWIISMARNLYWSIFLWFIPPFFAGLAYLYKDKKIKYLFYFLVLISIFIKSLCGYEYLSTIVLFTVSVYIIAPYFNFNTKNQTPEWKMAFNVILLCILGFLIALLFHASYRGTSISDGLLTIFKEDVQRRTFGDSKNFNEAYSPSLNSSVFVVIKKYILDWSTPLFVGLHGKLFQILLVLSSFGLVYKKITKHPMFKRDLILLTFTIIGPLSWFILAKSHSYIHTHISFVLWYIGFVPALVFVSLNSIVLAAYEIHRNIGKINIKDF